MPNGIIIRIKVVSTFAFWDIETNKKISIMIMIKTVNNVPNNFLKFVCDILGNHFNLIVLGADLKM